MRPMVRLWLALVLLDFARAGVVKTTLDTLKGNKTDSATEVPAVADTRSPKNLAALKETVDDRMMKIVVLLQRLQKKYFQLGADDQEKFIERTKEHGGSFDMISDKIDAVAAENNLDVGFLKKVVIESSSTAYKPQVAAQEGTTGNPASAGNSTATGNSATASSAATSLAATSLAATSSTAASSAAASSAAASSAAASSAAASSTAASSATASSAAASSAAASSAAASSAAASSAAASSAAASSAAASSAAASSAAASSTAASSAAASSAAAASSGTSTLPVPFSTTTPLPGPLSTSVSLKVETSTSVAPMITISTASTTNQSGNTLSSASTALPETTVSRTTTTPLVPGPAASLSVGVSAAPTTATTLTQSQVTAEPTTATTTSTAKPLSTTTSTATTLSTTTSTATSITPSLVPAAPTIATLASSTMSTTVSSTTETSASSTRSTTASSPTASSTSCASSTTSASTASLAFATTVSVSTVSAVTAASAAYTIATSSANASSTSAANTSANSSAWTGSNTSANSSAWTGGNTSANSSAWTGGNTSANSSAWTGGNTSANSSAWTGGNTSASALAAGLASLPTVHVTTATRSQNVYESPHPYWSTAEAAALTNALAAMELANENSYVGYKGTPSPVKSSTSSQAHNNAYHGTQAAPWISDDLSAFSSNRKYHHLPMSQSSAGVGQQVVFHLKDDAGKREFPNKKTKPKGYYEGTPYGGVGTQLYPKVVYGSYPPFYLPAASFPYPSPFYLSPYQPAAPVRGFPVSGSSSGVLWHQAVAKPGRSGWEQAVSRRTRPE